jgi:uncharacterized membrane protein YphA (DoxX/SURF4 family)
MEATQISAAPQYPPMGATLRAPRPVLWWVGTFGGAFLGCVLLFAVWAKAIDPSSFADLIHTEKLDFLLSARAVALIALALEAGLGLALLLGLRKTWVLVPTTLLVAFFVFLNARTWWLTAHGLRNAAESCGCFGNLVQRTPAEAFWQDTLLIVPALLLAWVGRERRPPAFPPLRTAVVAIGTVAAVVFAWMAPGLPLDDLATRLRPGVKAGESCVGEGAQRVCLDSMIPELQQGENLVVMAKLDDDSLTRAVDALNAYTDSSGKPALWVLTSSTAEQQRAFYWKWGPRFQIREAPPELLRPLYRRLPRSFEVKDGRVTRTYPGLPPLPQAADSKDSAMRSPT